MILSDIRSYILGSDHTFVPGASESLLEAMRLLDIAKATERVRDEEQARAVVEEMTSTTSRIWERETTLAWKA
jgi:hypothetical protein